MYSILQLMLCISFVYLYKVTYFSAGDIVQVIDDIASVHNFQENHGGWVDDMALVGTLCYFFTSWIYHALTQCFF